MRPPGAPGIRHGMHAATPGTVAQFEAREFELVMGLQRKGTGLVAYPMRPRKAGR